MLLAHDALWLAQTNCWVLATGRGEPALIVDAPPDVDRLGAILEANDLAAAGLLLTHGHVDHAGGAGSAESRYGVSTWVHPDDDFLTMRPLDQVRMLFGSTVPGDFEPPRSVVSLEHGSVIELAGFSLTALHTPGHTPGHVCFLLEEEGILFSGDQLFAGSIGRTDLPGGDTAALFRSMRDHVMPLPDDVRVLPGHGPETTVGRERRTNPFRAGWSDD